MPISLHAGQAPPNVIDAVDFEKRGWLGPKFLFCHYVPARDIDAEIMAQDQNAAELGDRIPSSGSAAPATRAPPAAHAQGRRDDLAVVRRHLDRAAQHVREHALHLEHGHPLARHADREGSRPSRFREAIQMATLNGAKALGIANITGSMTVGKRADIILIRGNDINIAPVADIEASVVQSATPANVDTVMVDGRIVKRARQARRLRRRQDRRKAKESALRIRVAAGGRLAPKL